MSLRGCGLDVHKASVAACVRVPGDVEKRVEFIQTFGTTTSDLLALRDWLQSHGVTHVAMASTGVYWKPIYSILEDGFQLILVEAALAASRSKDTYLAAQYRRLYRQRGHRKAVVAVGHSILVIAYVCSAPERKYFHIRHATNVTPNGLGKPTGEPRVLRQPVQTFLFHPALRAIHAPVFEVQKDPGCPGSQVPGAVGSPVPERPKSPAAPGTDVFF